MDSSTIVHFIIGLAFLIVGAEMLVRSASQLAAALGVPPLVIGLTVVAFGTGSPELAVAVRSAYAGEADIAIGNVIGSNIFNILFILGISAAIVPLVVANQLVRLDVPIMIASSILLFVMALDHGISRIEGGILFSGVVLYTVLLIRHSRRRTAQARQAEEFDFAPETATSWIVPVFVLIVGLALLVVGSRWLVNGAVGLAIRLGVSQLVIGLTIVAAGTSLPEVATSIIAGLRGQRDIAVGNVVGSNVYNILMVVGLAGLLSPSGLNVAPAALNFDIPVMVVVAIACLPIFFAGNVVRRWEGLLFLGYWISYTLYIVLDASNHDALPAFSMVMSVFVIPLTVLTIAIITLRALGRKMGPPAPPPKDRQSRTGST